LNGYHWLVSKFYPFYISLFTRVAIPNTPTKKVYTKKKCSLLAKQFMAAPFSVSNSVINDRYIKWNAFLSRNGDGRDGTLVTLSRGVPRGQQIPVF
jgi:hypothetical protein